MRQIETPFNVEAIRADFPILHQTHHNDIPLTFLDNAASSQKPVSVIETMNRYYRQTNANVHRGIHKLSELATAEFEESRKKVQRFINAGSRREVIFTRGTTEGINLVVQTWGRQNLKAGDVVLSTVMEHHSNIVPWQILAAEIGFEIQYVKITADGRLDLDHFYALLDQPNVKFVTLMHVSNVLGTINPIDAVIRAAHDKGIPVLVDAAQSVPHMPVDVQALNCDFLVFSGHKMIGPTGVGVLYGKRDHLEAMPPWQGGGDMISSVTLDGSQWNDLPYKFEAGTPSIAEVIGLGSAVDYLVNIGMDKIHDYEMQMATYLLSQLADIPQLNLYGPVDPEIKGAVAAFTVQGIHAHDVAQLLDEQGVAVRAGHHCAMPLHQQLNVAATARASFYFYNTLEEVDILVDSLRHAIATFDGF